jgi:D-glycero-D-manno-heptose 1,7-bisphosphate phosphatase
MFIVLDRDGVINIDSDDYIKSADEWQPIPGSLDAIVQLKNAGHTVVVVTNQSGVGRGYYTDETLQAIHTKMHACLAQRGVTVDGVYYCPHRPDENCMCRKPKPGLLEQAQKVHHNIWQDSLFVGDNISDYQCAKGVGCPFVLVRTGKGAKTESMLPQGTVPVLDDLSLLPAYLS